MATDIPDFTKAIQVNHEKLQRISPKLFGGHFLLDCLLQIILKPESDQVGDLYERFLQRSGILLNPEMHRETRVPLSRTYNSIMNRIHELVDPDLSEEETNLFYDETCRAILQFSDPERIDESLLRIAFILIESMSIRFNVSLRSGSNTPLQDFVNALEDRMPDWMHDGFSVIAYALHESGSQLKELDNAPMIFVQGLLNLTTWTEVERLKKLDILDLTELGDAGRLSPCPCGSGLPFHRCCGI